MGASSDNISNKFTNNINSLDGIPCQILGHHITTRTQISLSCLATSVLQLLVYLIVTTADIGVTVQHFRDENELYGSITLTLWCLPSIACFCSIVVSPWQWPGDSDGWNKENGKFFGKQLFNLLLFPFCAVYRLSRTIFWSIEALFHEENSYGRQHAVEKIMEPSTFELYHFLQAFLQAAPQVILQLYILLREDIFRNYETCSIQVVSIIFSLITMAIIITTYQRFESQKQVGRNYPWTTNKQIVCRKTLFTRSKSISVELKQPQPSYVELPQSDYAMNRFYQMNELNIDDQPSTSYATKQSLHLGSYNLNRTNADTTDPKKEIDFIDEVEEIQCNTQTEDLLNFNIRNSNELFVSNESLQKEQRCTSIRRYSYSQIETLAHSDLSPTFMAPPPPPQSAPILLTSEESRISTLHNLQDMTIDVANRFSKYKDMLILDTQLYIKENVPRLPKNFFNDINDNNTKPSTDNTNAKVDNVDSRNTMPSRRKIIAGIEQDDFAGKVIAFTSWLLFIFTRIIALSVFSVFYTKDCAYLCLAHYLTMLCCLLYETKFHEKLERTYFYVFLAYIYIFVILEFKIKFRKPRYWYVSYVIFQLVQNITITLAWYLMAEFESWWFQYLFSAIIVSSCYSIMCLLLYFFLLKPRDKVLFESDM